MSVQNFSLQKDRLSYFDIAKLIAIFLVIYGHCIQYYCGENCEAKIPWLFIYSFHLPLFMIISGYFSRSSLKLDFKTYFKKKTLHLLVPYLSWQLFSIVIKIILNDFEIEQIIRWNFWFLISLYICGLFAWVGYHLPNLYYKLLYFIITVIITQVSIFRLRDMYPCFLFGLLLGEKKEYVNNNRGILMLFSSILFILLSCFTLNEHFFDVGFTAKGIIKQINVWIVGMSASFTIIGFCKYIEKSVPGTISDFGKETLGIYLVQTILFTLSKDIINLEGYNTSLQYLLIIPFIALLYIILSLLIIKLIRKSEKISFYLLGK